MVSHELEGRTGSDGNESLRKYLVEVDRGR